MKLKKAIKIISIILGVLALAGGIYFAVTKLIAAKKPKYFSDNDFFECDNNLEVVEEKKEEAVEEPKEEAPKKSTKKTTKKEA